MAALSDQPLNCQLLAPPDELPANDCTFGMLPRPMALAVPDPAEAAGLLLAPMATLSNVQAARVVAAFDPDNEASSTDAIQAMFFIFILILILILLVGEFL